jgi:methyltransferase (TIGR00027 family)
VPTPLIQNVSDTAFLVAAHRAAETQRPDALFHDPLAELLAGEHGRQIAHAIRGTAAMTGWMVAIRTRIIDDFILEAVAQGTDTVLNLGAGLDTRPYRMRLPASLQWIEVDYPAVIELKQDRLADQMPVCALRRVSLDLTERDARRALFAEVASHASRVLVLTEGVVPYLSVDEAATLADDLRAEAAFRHWIVDYFSPRMMRFRDRPAIRRGMQNAPWRFRPEDYDRFFADHAWKPEQVRYIPIEAQRLHRPPPLPLLLSAWIRLSWLLAPKDKREALAKMAGYVLFEPS